MAWAALGVLALLVAAAALVGAFTRFDDGPAPQPGDPRFDAYEERQYDAARLSAMLGLVAAFALLATAACGQKALRCRAKP